MKNLTPRTNARLETQGLTLTRTQDNALYTQRSIPFLIQPSPSVVEIELSPAHDGQTQFSVHPACCLPFDKQVTRAGIFPRKFE
jgi:hypothetical protein